MLRKDSYPYKKPRVNCSGFLNSFMVMSAGHNTLDSTSSWWDTADTSSIPLCQIDFFVSYKNYMSRIIVARDSGGYYLCFT